MYNLGTPVKVLRHFGYRHARSLNVIKDISTSMQDEAAMAHHRRVHLSLAAQVQEACDNHDGYEVEHNGRRFYLFFSNWHCYVCTSFRPSEMWEDNDGPLPDDATLDDPYIQCYVVRHGLSTDTLI